ncbi:MAG TPA: histidine triad nucleotide-binding protein [Nitrospiraceae bacterium]|jgi:histidine triad (HIT) family protein|nr:histidine triad nucleotide-binding protein [Nitrospiraceae bacterium]
MSDCIFCRIVARTIPSKIVYEDEVAVVFEDVNPQAPVHILVVPRKHVPSLKGASTGDSALLGHLLLTCDKMAQEKGIAESGYRVVANTGTEGGQTVFHLHFHVLGGRPMHWPPG